MLLLYVDSAMTQIEFVLPKEEWKDEYSDTSNSASKTDFINKLITDVS